MLVNVAANARTVATFTGRNREKAQTGANAMATTQKRVDRRVERTRHILQQAFREVVQAKGFAATSIQDITERANLNRGTFYLHFADKYTLLDTFVREDIQHLLV